MKMCFIICVAPNEQALALMNFLDTSFGNIHGHHIVSGNSFNNCFGQGNSSSKRQIISFSARQFVLDFVNKIAKIFKMRFLPIMGTQGDYQEK